MPSSVASDSKLVRPEWRQWTTLNEWHWHVWKWENHRASAKIKCGRKPWIPPWTFEDIQIQSKHNFEKKCELESSCFFLWKCSKTTSQDMGANIWEIFEQQQKTSGWLSHPLFQKYASNCITFLSNLKGRNRSPRYLHLSPTKMQALGRKKCSN